MLNLRQHIFVSNYLVSFNATDSYRKAYSTANLRTAEVNGARLLRNAEVKAEINKEKALCIKRNRLEVDWVISRLMMIADTPMFFGINLSEDNLLDYFWKNLSGVKKFRYRKKGNFLHFKVEMQDKIEALSLLGRYLVLRDLR
ncbi:MAG: terminase small subunit [Bdellovibrionaceae bacterium]|nr:terminase small subunit [Pseudobdellovibrionaceae bacterium]